MKRLLVCLALGVSVGSAMSSVSSFDDLRQRADRGDQVAIEQLVWGNVERSDFEQASAWAQRLDSEDARRAYFKSWVIARSGDVLHAQKLLESCDSESCKVLYSSLLLGSDQLVVLDKFTREWWGSKFSVQAFVWHAYALLASNDLLRFDSLMLEAEKVGASQPSLLGYVASIKNLRPKVR